MYLIIICLPEYEATLSNKVKRFQVQPRMHFEGIRLVKTDLVTLERAITWTMHT